MLRPEELIPALERLIATELSNWPVEWIGFTWPGYTYEHTLRVRCLGVTIGRRPGADRRVVELVALLHDIGKPLGEPHSETGAHRADLILSGLGVDDITRQAVCSIIRSHLSKDAGAPAEGLALYDADFIDANYGYVAIARYITIRAHRQQTVEYMVADAPEWLSGMEKKLGQVLTAAGRGIAVERFARMRTFLDQLRQDLSESTVATGCVLSLARFIASDTRRPSLMGQLEVMEDALRENRPGAPLQPSAFLCRFACALREEIEGRG
jgi:putative nucleotidyltransferase with HDIG domain